MMNNERREIFSDRLVVAVAWNILLQTVIAIVLVFVIQVDLLHPVEWITSTLSDILGWKMILNIALLALVSFFQAYIYGSYYMVPIPKYFTRFSMFLTLFSVQNLTFTLLYILSSYFTLGLYSSLAKSMYSTLQKPCISQENSMCLLEQSIFLQIGGMFMGLYYFLRMHFFGYPTLVFPHVYQDKFQQIKLAISTVLTKGFTYSVLPVFLYCILYYIWGSKPRNLFMSVYGLQLEDPNLDSIVNLLTSGIWIGLWFYTSLFFVSIYTMKTVFNIILTEPVKFPIESETGLNLHTALSFKYQFQGCLAAQDLKILSMNEPQRRAQIFTLSQPGGHPRNWNSILSSSLAIINDLSKELEHINDLKLTQVDQRANVSPLKMPIASLRNMAQSPKLLGLKDHNKNEYPVNYVDMAKVEFNNLVYRICQKPGISYFFGEMTDTKLKHLLLQAQPVMWTCEGLAFLVASSLKEDKYGVVQNDLPQVISSLINLKYNLDKLTKLGLVPRKQILHDAFAIKMKTALSSSVKRSIYKIVITFSNYIHDLQLDPEVMVAIQPFLFFKEA